MSIGRQTRTEVVSEVVFLGKLVERIAAGKIRVPRFQRDFVWKQQDMHALLDSVFQGFPIGSILVWDTEKRIDSPTHIGPISVGSRPDGLVSYLLDGQQRVSTLVGTLRLPEEGESTVEQIDWRVYFDLENQEFVRAPREGAQPQHFPMGNLLNTTGFFAACRRIVETVSDKRHVHKWLNEADRLANAFRDYQLPLIHIREADLDSAVTVFARLNRTGRKMSADEMVSALTYRRGEFHLAEKLGKFKDELAKQGFGNLNRVLLLRAVLAALDRDIYAKDWADLMVKDDVRSRLPESSEVAADGIRKALVFLKDLGVTSDRLLPYGLQLVLLGEFYRHCPQPPADVKALLSRWFWVTSFTGWFGAISTSKVTRALRDIRDLAGGRRTGFSVIDLDTPALPFPDRFDGRSARVRAFMLYLASLKPYSLRSPNNLEAGQLLSTLGTKAMAYVAPYNRDNPVELYSSPANRMFIDSDLIGNAFSHLADLDDDRLGKLLPTHGFPIDSVQLLRDGDHAGLIRLRLDTLIDGERAFLEGRKVKPPEMRTAASIADSDSSDEDD